MQLASEVKESRIVSSDAPDEAAILKNAFISEGLSKEGEILIESYDQMAKLVKLLHKAGIKTLEPFSGQIFTGWPEVKVLGPTKAFYKSCYDKMSGPRLLLLEEARAMREDRLLLEKPLKLAPLGERTLNPCKFLDEQSKDAVTEINQVSIILEITASKKKYLFTGDASIESFEAIPAYKDALKEIYWLKVAHHGSHNNSSSALFDIMKPKFADISGGNRYLDNEVQDCLIEKGAVVRTTRDAKANLLFPA